MNYKLSYIRNILKLNEKDISKYLNISAYKYKSLERNSFNISFDILYILSIIYEIPYYVLSESIYDDQYIYNILKRNGMLIQSREELENRFSQNLNNNCNFQAIGKIKKELNKTVISNLNRLIEEKAISIEEFANIVDIEYSSIISIISGRRIISINELSKISTAFSIQPNSFFQKNNPH